jgi:hypothetical protein
VTGFLNALADNNGQAACDLLTPNARLHIVVSADCKTRVAEFFLSRCPPRAICGFTSIRADEALLKDAKVSGESTEGSQILGGRPVRGPTTVIVTLHGRSARAPVVKINGKWRLDSANVAAHLLGIG